MRPLAFVIFSLVMLGCTHEYNRKELVGKYSHNAGHTGDRLELKLDGTYTHTFQSAVGNQNSQTGTWDIENIEGNQTVVLNDFADSPNGSGKGYYLLPIESYFGRVWLATNEDTNEGYEK